MQEAIQAALQAQEWKPEKVDLYVLHQANLRIVQAVAEQMGLSMEHSQVWQYDGGQHSDSFV